MHPIHFRQTGCGWSKADADALLAANAAWKTTVGAKSSIGGIAAPQSLNKKYGMLPMRFMKFDVFDFAIFVNYLGLPDNYLRLTMRQGMRER